MILIFFIFNCFCSFSWFSLTFFFFSPNTLFQEGARRGLLSSSQAVPGQLAGLLAQLGMICTLSGELRCAFCTKTTTAWNAINAEHYPDCTMQRDNVPCLFFSLPTSRSPLPEQETGEGKAALCIG